MAHEELRKLYAIDAEYSDKPWEKWEIYYEHNEWETMQEEPIWSANCVYRRKQPEPPLTITIKAGDRWTSEPPKGAEMWYVNLDGKVDYLHDRTYYEGGQLFKTKEAAQAFAGALKIK